MTTAFLDAVLARVASFRANRRALASCAALYQHELAAFDAATPAAAALRRDRARR